MNNIFVHIYTFDKAHPDGRQNEWKSFWICCFVANPWTSYLVIPFYLRRHYREGRGDEAIEHSSRPSSYANRPAPVSNQVVQHNTLLLCLGYVLLGSPQYSRDGRINLG